MAEFCIFPILKEKSTFNMRAMYFSKTPEHSVTTHKTI
jgi:hypothetical protein